MDSFDSFEDHDKTLTECLPPPYSEMTRVHISGSRLHRRGSGQHDIEAQDIDTPHLPPQPAPPATPTPADESVAWLWSAIGIYLGIAAITPLFIFALVGHSEIARYLLSVNKYTSVVLQGLSGPATCVLIAELLETLPINAHRKLHPRKWQFWRQAISFGAGYIVSVLIGGGFKYLCMDHKPIGPGRHNHQA